MKGQTIGLDFDGVLHMYTSRWTKADEILDGPVPGAVEFVNLLQDKGFRVVVHSSRLANGVKAARAVRYWLKQNGFPDLELSAYKPPTWLSIDDRAWCFDGKFPTIEDIENFRPWNKRDATPDV